MIFETNKEKGRAGMALAIAYFGSNGYTVNIPMNDTQWYDLVIEKDGVFQTVQCKATGSQDNSINLKSTGGTKGKVYDNVLDHSVDLLFCLDQFGNMFVIPVEDIRKEKVVKNISLRTSPTINNQGFQTYLYLVNLFDNTQKEIHQDEKKIKENINTCCDCGCNISNKAIRCRNCASIAKIIPVEKMPISRQELKNLIRTKSFVSIGKDFEVSDNAVRKWCKKYCLPTTKTDINSYSDEEWNLI